MTLCLQISNGESIYLLHEDPNCHEGGTSRGAFEGFIVEITNLKHANF